MLQSRCARFVVKLRPHLINRPHRFSPLLEQEEDSGVFHEGAKHEEDADHQVEVDGVQPGGDGGVLPVMFAVNAVLRNTNLRLF